MSSPHISIHLASCQFHRHLKWKRIPIMWIRGWDKQSTGPFLNILPNSMKGAVGGSLSLQPVSRVHTSKPHAAGMYHSINRLPSSVFPLPSVSVSGSRDSISHLSPLPWVAAQCLYLSTSGFMPFLRSVTGSEGVEACGCCHIQQSSNHILPLAVLVAITFTQSNLKRICWVISVAAIKYNMREDIFLL